MASKCPCGQDWECCIDCLQPAITCNKPRFPPPRILSGLSEGIHPSQDYFTYIRPVVVDPIDFKCGDDHVEIPDALYQAYRKAVMDGTGVFTIGIGAESQTVVTDYVHPFLNTDTEN